MAYIAHEQHSRRRGAARIDHCGFFASFRNMLPALLLLSSLCCVSAEMELQEAEPCPKLCNCTVPTVVNCAGKGLKSVPPGIPNDTTVLRLSNNKLTELKAGDLLGLSELRELYLSDNQLKTVQPEAAKNLSNLEKVYLTRNKLVDFPDFCSEAGDTVTHLAIDENKIKDKVVPSVFAKCEALESLILTKNMWRAINNSTLAALPPSLKSLKLNYIGLQLIDPLALKSVAPNLRSLDLSDNQKLPVEQVAALLKYSEMPNLLNLILKQMSFAELPAGFLGKTSLLNILQLERCSSLRNISESALSAGSTSITTLLMRQTALTSWTGQALSQLNKLRQLDLSDTEVLTIGGKDGKQNSLAQLVVSESQLDRGGLQLGGSTQLLCDCNLLWLAELLQRSNKTVSYIKDAKKLRAKMPNGTQVPLLQCRPEGCIHNVTTTTTSTTGTTTPATSTTKSPTSAGMPAWSIVLVSVASLVILALAVASIVVCRRHQQIEGGDSCFLMSRLRGQSYDHLEEKADADAARA